MKKEQQQHNEIEADGSGDVVMNPQLAGDLNAKFPLTLATALFSFLYHLASYDAGGEALVSCGMMESLLQVINWHGVELEHITVSIYFFLYFIVSQANGLLLF